MQLLIEKGYTLAALLKKTWDELVDKLGALSITFISSVLHYGSKLLMCHHHKPTLKDQFVTNKSPFFVLNYASSSAHLDLGILPTIMIKKFPRIHQ